MSASSMHLRLLLPFKVFIDEPEVAGIVAETAKGSWGFLPNRLDCVVPIEPGILMYRLPDGREEFVAVDQGILLKIGADVTISARHASSGADLGRIRRTVEEEFLAIGEREREVRDTLAKLEGSFIRRYLELRRG